MKQQITRRDFMATTAAGLGSFLVLETLQSCDGGGKKEEIWKTPPDLHAAYPIEFTEETKYTSCWIGKQDCGMTARVLTQTIGDREVKRIVKFEGNPDNPRNNGTLCPKGFAQLQGIYDYNRVKTPLKRTNAKGEAGAFVQISWDEALNTVADKLKAAKSASSYVLWQKGRSKSEPLYDGAFINAMKEAGYKNYKIGHGAYCSDSGYRAAEYTIGYHGVYHPDFKNTKYLLSWGWNLTSAGGNKFCFITWPQEFVKARANGMKVVALDPFRRGTGPHADEWIPNKPGTDLAFFLGLQHYLVTNGHLDKDYLKTYTNAPYLVKDDGTVAKVTTTASDGTQTSKELVWDTKTSAAVAYDTAGIDPVLDGSYTVDGATVKPALERMKDHLTGKGYTPAWADSTCDIPSGTVERVARELASNANIGGTTTIDGITLPLRPSAMMAYHVTQQELGMPAGRAAIMVFMLLGAVGVPGGTQIDIGATALHENYKKLDEAGIKDGPYNWDLSGSKFFPIKTTNPSFLANIWLNPSKYGVNEATLPKVAIFHMNNGAVSFADSKTIREAWKRIEFVVDINPWLSDTASLFADVILPAATIEKYEGPGSGKALYEKADSLRMPPIPALWESRGEMEIYIDIADRAGFLTGDKGLVAQLNKELSLSGNKMDVSSKPTVRDMFDRWAKDKLGKADGIAYLEQHGNTGRKAISAKDAYPAAQSYAGAKHRLYGESLLKYQTTMKGKGVEAIYYQDYTAFPTWRAPTMYSSPGTYDLHLISYKKIEHKQSRSSFVPLLAELAPKQGLVINSATAKAKGIAEGDAVTVTSHNAVTGETRSIRTAARLVESIRPDTVALSHHYGITTHPNAKDQGPTPNELFFTSEGYVQCTMDASFQVKVGVSKA
ncbi:MAG: molybdopterin-dependent oxidoreductase [Nitrospirae bacterium]|nr:molybdopterin-dependent oxidoreductase [Nitrospirota bacterium]